MKSKLILTAAVLSAMAGGGSFLTLRIFRHPTLQYQRILSM